MGQKDKKHRLLRNLRKEASVRLDDDGRVAFDDDSLGMQCLTSSGEYKNLGQLNKSQARIFICQNWLNEKGKIEKFLWRISTLNFLMRTTTTIQRATRCSRTICGKEENKVQMPKTRSSLTRKFAQISSPTIIHHSISTAEVALLLLTAKNFRTLNAARDTTERRPSGQRRSADVRSKIALAI